MRQWRAPLGSSTDRHRQTAKLCKKPPVAVHHRSACSGVKALRNTSAAKRQAAKPWLAFRSLDTFRALREPDRRRRDEERPFPLPTKNRQQTKKPLDRKTPIQVCELLVSKRRKPICCCPNRSSRLPLGADSCNAPQIIQGVGCLSDVACG